MARAWVRLGLTASLMLSLLACRPARFAPPGNTNLTASPATPNSEPTAALTPTMPRSEPYPSTTSTQPPTVAAATPARPVETTEAPPVRDIPPPTPRDPAVQQSVVLAREDLALRLTIAADQIEVVAVIGQEFTADAFYCRAKKERTARDESLVVIAGESIVLSAAGRRYEYHASGQTIIFCRPLS